MQEWKQAKAVRRLVWVAIGFAIFPGAFFVVLSSWAIGFNPEVLLGLYPALLMGSIALALHRFRPSHPPAMEQWRPERELITPLPRPVEPRWSTPRRTLPMFLWLFPAFYLLMVVVGYNQLRFGMLALLSSPALLTSAHVAWRLRGHERQLLALGAVARGKIRRVITGRGFFKMKVEYEFDGTEYFTWTDNLSPKTWFGPLFVEEKKFITLVVDRQRPERFLVYPFCGHLVPSSSRGREA